jgi:hypothetical protein
MRDRLNVEATPSVTAFVLRLLKAQPSNRLELQKESPALYDELAPAINVILKCVPLIKALEKELENELKVKGDTVDGWFNRAVIDLLAANIEMYTMLSIIYRGGLFRSTNGVFRGSEIDLFRRFVLDPVCLSTSPFEFYMNHTPLTSELDLRFRKVLFRTSRLGLIMHHPICCLRWKSMINIMGNQRTTQ